jgi:succinyl-diaminopimelate desuccinylase
VDTGWIHGRGTADMKGSIASLLLALRALRATKVAPALNIEVSFTADEETDSALGAGWMVEHGGIKPDYALVMEGGEGRRIGCGHNGVVWLEVSVHGRAAHGSVPHEGVNALEHAMPRILP